MRLKKVLLVLICIFFLTGCEVEYNVDINRDLSVKEYFTATELNSSLLNRKIYSVQELISEVSSNTTVKKENYLISNYVKDETSGAKVSRNYSSLSDYAKTLNTYDLIPNKTEYSQNSNIITFESKIDKLYISEEFVALSYPIVSKVNIKIPFEVTYNNADFVDEEHNIYTWNVTNTDSKKEQIIKFSADTSRKKYDFSEIIKILIITIVLILLVIFISTLLRIKSKRNNKI